MKKTVFLAEAYRRNHRWKNELIEILYGLNDEYIFFDSTLCAPEAEYNLYRLRKSDFVIANVELLSVENISEIAVAHELRIPVIGYAEHNMATLPSWIKEFCINIFDDMEDLAEYIVINF